MKWMALGAAFIAAIAAQSPIAQGAVLIFETTLGPEALGATGSGSSRIEIDANTHELQIEIDWNGLSGTTTVAHIHCCTALPPNVAVTPISFPGFPGFPGVVPGFESVPSVMPGVTSGNYLSPIIPLDETFSYTGNFLSNFGGGTVAGAEAALIAGLLAGTAYVNVHSTTFPSGEIRGFPVLTAIPEPSSLLIVAAALGGLGLMRRRKPVSRE